MVTKTHTIPQSEGKFDLWVRNFVRAISSHPENYRIDQAEIDELTDQFNKWDADLNSAIAARDQARAAVENKDESRKTLESHVRGITRVIQADKNVTDASRREAGITVHKNTRTPVGVPKTFPLGQVLATDRLEQTISFTDSATPTRRARPKGCNGCEIYLAVGDAPPTDPKDYRFVALATRSSHTVSFSSEDGGKTANYLLRWVNTKGETGPWSQTVSATVPTV